MRYVHKSDFLDPNDVDKARQRLATTIGGIILAWNDLERQMNRAIQMERVSEQEFGQPLDDRPSHKVEENINEWLRRFMPEPSHGLTPNDVRQWLLDLKTVRDDLAHNVHNYGIDPEHGPFINRVRQNHSYDREFAAYTEKVRSGEKRNVPPHPQQFIHYSYVEEGLLSALEDLIAVTETMLQIYVNWATKRYQPRRGQDRAPTR